MSPTDGDKILPKPLREANLGKKLNAIIWKLREIGRDEIANAILRDMRVLLNYAELEKPFEYIWAEVKNSLETGTFLTPLPEEVKKIIDLEASKVDISEDLKKYDVDPDEMMHNLEKYYYGSMEIESKIMNLVPDLPEENPDLFNMLLSEVIPVDLAIELWKKYKDKMKRIKTLDDLYAFLWEVKKANVIKSSSVLEELKKDYPAIVSTLESLKLIVVGYDLKNHDYLIVYVFDFERLKRIPVVFPLVADIEKFLKLIPIAIRNVEGNVIKVYTLEDAMKEELKVEDIRKEVEKLEVPTPPKPEYPKKKLVDLANELYNMIKEAVDTVKEEGITSDVVIMWSLISEKILELYREIFKEKRYLQHMVSKNLKGAYKKAWEYFVEKCYENNLNPYRYVKEFDNIVMVMPENEVERYYKKIIDGVVIAWIKNLVFLAKSPPIQYEMDNSPRNTFRRYKSIHWLRKAIESCEIKARIVKGAIEKGYKLSQVKKYLDELTEKVRSVEISLIETLNEHQERIFRRVRKDDEYIMNELKKLVEDELERYKKFLFGEEKKKKKGGE